MIMFFADVHMGHRLYHRLTDEFITTAEQDTRIALDAIYERAKQPDIDMIICGGDFFNTSKPSTESIRWSIEWYRRIESLNKPFYLIPGNHDIGTHFHAMEFQKALGFSGSLMYDQEVHTLKWNDWNVYFVPFMAPRSSKNKYETTLEALKTVVGMMNPADKNIIVTHLQESKSKLGTESTMIARAVEVVDLDEVWKSLPNTIFLSGHMHMRQEYVKNNGMVVTYPGSLTYIDMTDCGLQKGYLLIDTSGKIVFESVPGIRTYKRYSLPIGKDPVEYFTSMRLPKNEVVFLDVQDDTIVDEEALRDFFDKRGSYFAKVIYPKPEEKERSTIKVDHVARNPLLVLTEFLEKKFTADQSTYDWRSGILPMGQGFLDNATEKN